MKKILSFLVGAFLSAAAIAQPPANVNGVTINGAAATNNSAIALNSMISFGGYTFMIIPIPDMNINDGVIEEQLEQNITIALINAGIVVDVNANGVNNTTLGLYGNEATRNGDAYFGFDTGNYTLQVVQQIPFDLGISAILGAGAIAAVKTARKRRKEAQAIA